MNEELERLLDRQGGVVTSGQALTHLSRRELQAALKQGVLQQIWHGIYGRGEVDPGLRLRGLDLATDTTVAVCLSTAAEAYGFDTEETAELHVLNPDGQQLRPAKGLMVHRREGAPLAEVAGRPITAPAWTAIEVARELRRPRALATLDAALRSGSCRRDELHRAAEQQSGRRGIVAVRELLPLADPRAESPMESEARLVMIDGGLPPEALQYEIVDADFRTWRVDFAWPEHRVAVEYDGEAWHSGPEAFVYDRRRRAALQNIGWVVVALIADDVRRRPWETVRRIETQLERSKAA
ncbi:MAG TPA: type IV toxin-antitoxin system AbiEi family antitoxin domain-containing protein [Mycobacterium sp.]|nr:type IV toxin-antitoxin system AbiEi family antitoxin domain-containing protein [Mycobacterium sp.]